MSAQLDRVPQRPSHCLAKTLLAQSLAPLSLSRFCGLRGSSCTLVILDRAPALAQGTELLGPTLSRAMTLYSPRPPSVCADFLQWSAVLEGPLALRSSLIRPVSWAPPARMLAGGRGSIPRGGAAADRRLRAPTVAKHLVSTPPTSCHVSSPRLHARVASRAAPALAPPLPHHTRPPLSSARHLLPLAFGSHAASRRVDFWGRRKMRPRALPQPRPRSPFEQPYGPLWLTARLAQLLVPPPSLFWPPSPP